MNFLFDKLVLFTGSLAVYLVAGSHLGVVPIIVVIPISAFNSYFESSHLARVTGTLALLLSLFWHEYVFFVPLLCYDLLSEGYLWALGLALLPLAVHAQRITSTGVLLITLFLTVSWLMNRRTRGLLRMQDEYITLRDATKELLLALESKNQELMEKQDYEINLATLNERNRIARDIHDHVGHVLSSALLQIGALSVLTGEETVREGLARVKESLARGLDSIRNSIHNLHDDSVDLHSEVYALIRDFTFCPVEFRDDIESRPDTRVTYCIVAIIKEALANIIRHSNATRVYISILEHPALYQLIVADNGTTAKGEVPAGNGIGLRNIVDRVRKLNGNVHVRSENGFEVFVSIPKGEL